MDWFSVASYQQLQFWHLFIIINTFPSDLLSTKLPWSIDYLPLVSLLHIYVEARWVISLRCSQLIFILCISRIVIWIVAQKTCLNSEQLIIWIFFRWCQSTGLIPLSLTDADSLVVVNKDQVILLGAAVCLSLALANRIPGLEKGNVNLPPASQCYTAWLCNTKQSVMYTSMLLRQFLAKTVIPATTVINSENNQNGDAYFGFP